jgi:hypothetical protein
LKVKNIYIKNFYKFILDSTDKNKGPPKMEEPLQNKEFIVKNTIEHNAFCSLNNLNLFDENMLLFRN